MDFESYLKETAQKLEAGIGEILRDWLGEVRQISPKLVPLAKAFIKASQGGKRIRGSLIKLGYEIARVHLREGTKLSPGAHLGGETGEILKVGAAYEIFHASILAHDDIIDKSPTRRNQPSLYKKVGQAQAITLADLGFFLAIKIFSESRFEVKRKIAAINFFAKTVMDTAIGQMLDIANGDPETKNRLKTAKYTISGPLKLGAILAEAEEELLGRLGSFGENVGIAFQIQDDILDKEITSLNHAEALDYVSKGKKIIPKIIKDQRLSTLLEQMAEYLVNRKR